MPTHQVTVESLTRGKIAGINDARALVQASSDEGTVVNYWCPITDAPQVGTTITIDITPTPKDTP